MATSRTSAVYNGPVPIPRCVVEAAISHLERCETDANHFARMALSSAPERGLRSVHSARGQGASGAKK